MNKFLFVSILGLALSGCCTQQFTIVGDKVPTVPTYEGRTDFIFWGLGQTKTMDPKEVCGSRGVKAVETHYTFIEGLASSLTWGIYSPRGYSIYCNK